MHGAITMNCSTSVPNIMANIQFIIDGVHIITPVCINTIYIIMHLSAFNLYCSHTLLAILFSFSHALNDVYRSDNVYSQSGNVVHGVQYCK